MDAIEKNKETLKKFAKLISDFNKDIGELEKASGFYVNLTVNTMVFAGSLRKRSIVCEEEVCIY